MNSDTSHDQWQASLGNEALAAEEKPAKTPVAGAPAALAGSSAGKIVLLVDSNPQTRDARAKMMRSRGATVHCVESVSAARTQLESGTYNLVLLDPGTDFEGTEQLADEIRAKNPRQLVAFLVGSPMFVAKSLRGVRPRAVVPRPAAVPAPTANPPVGGDDFGQRIRDAENAAAALR